MSNEQNEMYSKVVRAGKRTYFFDIKSTRANDYYITITESKRRMNGDSFTYEKHKIFLYKEDFFKFANALNEAVDHVKNDLKCLDEYDSLLSHCTHKFMLSATYPNREGAYLYYDTNLGEFIRS